MCRLQHWRTRQRTRESWHTGRPAQPRAVPRARPALFCAGYNRRGTMRRVGTMGAMTCVVGSGCHTNRSSASKEAPPIAKLSTVASRPLRLPIKAASASAPAPTATWARAASARVWTSCSRRSKRLSSPQLRAEGCLCSGGGGFWFAQRTQAQGLFQAIHRDRSVRTLL